jgi:prevent-host-death family protein
MKPKSSPAKRPKPGPQKAMAVGEAAAAYMAESPLEVSVRAAKDGLSALLEHAAAGAQIVITSDGKPKAMLVRYRPVITSKPWVSLADFRAGQKMTSDSTALIRAERDSGY